MSQNAPKSQRIASVQNVKLRHRVPERMRRDSHSRNVCRVTIGMHLILQCARVLIGSLLMKEPFRNKKSH